MQGKENVLNFIRVYFSSQELEDRVKGKDERCMCWFLFNGKAVGKIVCFGGS